MNPELDSLLAALQAAPGDDALWLVAGDWLEENGQSDRAALLRLVRRLRGMPLGPERLALETQAQALLRKGVKPCMPVLANSIGMQLALVPPGQFWIGSEENEEGRYDDETPRVLVPVPTAFYLGVTAVTQAEYAKVASKRPSGFRAGGRMKQRVEGLDTSRFPVERVDWHEAAAFCAALSALPAEKEAGRVYRLPTEAEWEYACRAEAAQMSPYPHGPELSTKLVNYRAGSTRSRSYLGRPVEAGCLPPNAFGLHEMTGNTWEWCGDWYQDDAYAQSPAEILRGPQDGDRRNARGGTYALEDRRARSADRSSFDPDHKDHDLGFRVLMEWRGKPEAPASEKAPRPKRKRGK